MPDIQVEIRPGEFAPFEISGEKPNYVEMKQIEKLVMEMESQTAAFLSVLDLTINLIMTQGSRALDYALL
jgi:hypothetical protein